MPRHNGDLVRTVIIVIGFLAGGGFLFDLVGDLGGLEVKVNDILKEDVGVLRSDLEDIEDRVSNLEKGGTGRYGKGVGFDEAKFEEEVLAEVQYLIDKSSEVQIPGFLEMDKSAKERVVKCLLFDLASWRVSKRCVGGRQDFLDLACVDEATGEILEVPLQVKRLASSCSPE